MNNFFWDLETDGLLAFDSVISCLTYAIDDGEIISFSCQDEKKIIEDFFNVIKDKDFYFFGYNSNSFDVPFLVTRAIYYNLIIPQNFLNFSNHKDLRNIANLFFLHYEKMKTGKLGDWAKLMGIEVKTENGLKMLEYYKNKQFDLIKEHNAEDVDITRKLYNKLKYCGVIQ